MIEGYKTVNELAAEWDVILRTIQTMCSDGRVSGAVKFGREWVVPADTERPDDESVMSGKYKGWRSGQQIALIIRSILQLKLENESEEYVND